MKRIGTIAATATVALVLASCGVVGQQDAQPSVSAPTTCNPSRSAPSGTTSQTLSVGGTTRTYQLVVPTSYDGTKPTPVVFAFHGRGGSGAQQVTYTGISQAANANGYIAVAPDAQDGQWQFPMVPGQQTPDTTFISELQSHINLTYCTDQTREYAEGMSLGSAMTFVLACSPERKFAAFAGVGATFYRPQCNTSPPAPIMYFHGTDDPIVPFGGGAVSGSPANGPTSRVGAATEVMADWAKHNGCPAEPKQTTVADTTLIRWAPCKSNAVVNFYRINGGGHTWPGSDETIALFLEPSLGKTSVTDANKLIWAFFTQYSLPTN